MFVRANSGGGVSSKLFIKNNLNTDVQAGLSWDFNAKTVIVTAKSTSETIVYLNDCLQTRQWYQMGNRNWTLLNSNTLCDTLTQKSLVISSWLTNNPGYTVTSVVPITDDFPTSIA